MRPAGGSERWAEYTALVAVWLATRAIALASVDMTPWMLNDLRVYEGWLPTLQHLAFPVLDPTWQYPPGASLVFLGADLSPIPFRWSFTVFVLLVDAAILATLFVAHARTPGARWRGLWMWALAAIVVGPIMLTRFDLVPTLFAVLAIALAGRPAWSGVMAAVGFAVKLWPALMLLALPRSGTRRGVVSFALTSLVMLASFALLFDNSLSFLSNQRARGIQVESTGALPYLLHSLTGGDVAFGLEYGSIQVLMNGTDVIGTLVTIAGVALLGVIAWWRFRGRLDSVPTGDVALTLMLVSVATSRVYSPQFNTWLVGIAAIALISRRCRLGAVSVLVIVIAVLTQSVYPWMATQLVTGGTAAIAVQSLRIVLLLVATTMAMRSIAASRNERPAHVAVSASDDARQTLEGPY